MCIPGASTNRIDQALLRILEARQLSLKLIANTTYGFAGASFTGRMPCSDIADAIVQTGRASLERVIIIDSGTSILKMIQIFQAIRLVMSNPEWNGTKVVYGDTDSIFVNMPSISKDDAFKIGNEIAVGNHIQDCSLSKKSIVYLERSHEPSSSANEVEI